MTKRKSPKKRSNKMKEDIHKQFKPNKTPKQVFRMGAFGGTYFRPIYSSVTNKNYTPEEAMKGLPKSWFQGLDMEKILAWKIMPRFMMLVMSVMYIRVLEWGMSLDDLSTQQSAMISVCSGAMTGAFAVWLGSEK